MNNQNSHPAIKEVKERAVSAHKFADRMSIMAQDGVARLWDGESISKWQSEIVARDVKSTLTAYLKHILGIAR